MRIRCRLKRLRGQNTRGLMVPVLSGIRRRVHGHDHVRPKRTHQAD